MHKPPVTRLLSKRDIDSEKDRAIILEWYERAREVEHTHTLKKVIDHLLEDYNHDYASLVHAITAGALATASCMNAQAGLDQHQAATVMWEFIRGWMRYESPLRLLDFDKMLYPQYAENFEKVITPATWEWIQAKAKEILDSNGGLPVGAGQGPMSWAVRNHLKNIVHAQIVPFGYEVRE